MELWEHSTQLERVVHVLSNFMVDLSLIHNGRDGFLSDFINEEIHKNGYSIIKNSRGNWRLIETRKKYNNIHNEDEKQFITNYACKLLEKNFDSILISGLGLGIIPFVCQNYTKTIDVVEIDSEIIQIVSDLKYLGDTVNIINSDIYDFTPDRKYDLILFDHWLTYGPKNEIEKLCDKFLDYLNVNGTFYIPINEQFRK